MIPEKIVLVIIEIAGGELRGKTLLQKQAYFISEFLQIDLGFKAHFYGPYSQVVEDALDYNKYLGFVNENCFLWGEDPYGFEQKRYDYILSDYGKEIVNKIRLHESDEYNKIYNVIKKIEQAGISNDYISISIAAKVYYILTQPEKLGKITPKKIEKIAKEFGWNISPESIKSAINLIMLMWSAK